MPSRAQQDFTPGRHRVADNLYRIIDGNRRSWVFIYRSPLTGLRREMGLGPLKLVSLTRAKELAHRHCLAVYEGRDPLEERRAARPKAEDLLTFRQVAELYIGVHEQTWRNPKHRAQWRATLETYAYPILGNVAVKDVDTGMVMRVLEQNVAGDDAPPASLWLAKPETAARLRGRVEVVINYAAARHWRQGDNPARWKGHIENLLPRRAKVKPVAHHAALDWRDLPALWSDIARRADVSARALGFTLLTATRTGEAIGARWSEIDLTDKLWTVPAERMKAHREFRVPLSTAAIVVLEELAALRQGDYVFPGAKAGRPISNMAMLMMLRRLRPGMTTHGTVRSGFRDWASEQGISGEVAEASLAHAVKDKVEAAYRRGDLLEPRRAAMERWARFLTESATAKEVIALRRRG